MRGELLLIGAMFGAGIILMMTSLAESQEAPRISKEEVRQMLGNQDVIIIDVRQENDLKKSSEKIKGAVREDPDKVTSQMDKYLKDKTLIFYCA